MPLEETPGLVTPVEGKMSRILTDAAYLRRYFKTLLRLALLGLLAVLPYTWWWLHQSGDVAVERAVEAQAKGAFALFGSGVSQDFVDYKLRLYAAVKPDITAVGSSAGHAIPGGLLPQILPEHRRGGGQSGGAALHH